MSVLKELRGELTDAIHSTTQLTTYDYVPGRAHTPCAFVLAGSPYIEAGQTFGTRHVRLGVVILTGPYPNDVQTDQLDAWIEDVQHDLEESGWTVEQVDQPRIEDFGGQEVLATTIQVGCDADFTREQETP